MAALAQGGGLGIFGDFLFSEKNRFGGGIEKTLAGPQVGVIGDVLNAGVSNAVRAVQGEKTYLGRDISNLIRYNTPVASSLWYTRKAFDAAIADQLQMLLDPDAQANMRRQERKRDKAFGNTSWWNRGDLLPSKAPDLRNALNGRE
ncbi:MAG: hypothetical protein CML60_10520 [Rhodobacteraceae bacterium]|nr:hypothetical protein [Paracoccaceae bacterium]